MKETAQVTIIITPSDAAKAYPKLYRIRTQDVFYQHIRPRGIDIVVDNPPVFAYTAEDAPLRFVVRVTHTINDQSDKQFICEQYKEHLGIIPGISITVAVS